MISSSQNDTLAKSLLGCYKNMDSCVLDCCRMDNCDLVLFDGVLCYGVYCSAENVCHFQPALEGQKSFKAVFLNNVFEGR